MMSPWGQPDAHEAVPDWWAVYTIGLLASPWAVAIGLALVGRRCSGGRLSGRRRPVDKAIKHGPFGTKPRVFAHMEDHFDSPTSSFDSAAWAQPQGAVSSVLWLTG